MMVLSRDIAAVVEVEEEVEEKEDASLDCYVTRAASLAYQIMRQQASVGAIIRNKQVVSLRQIHSPPS